MNKKIAAIVGLAAVIAASGGLISMNAGRDRGADSDPASGQTYAAVTEADAAPEETSFADTGAAGLTEAPDETEAVQTEDTEADAGGDVNGCSGILAGSRYSVMRVYDHSVGTEVTAREVFGRYHASCYLSFGYDGSFELCLNPSAGEIRRGSYKVYGDVIFAEYDSGSGSEFTVYPDGSGGIESILVSYGDYDVYFG